MYIEKQKEEERFKFLPFSLKKMAGATPHIGADGDGRQK